MRRGVTNENEDRGPRLMTPMSNALTTLLAAFGLAVAAPSCFSDDPEADASAACEEPIDEFKELLIVDEAALDTPRAKNAEGGVWSFRHAIESMAPDGVDGGEFVARWLMAWIERKELNGFPLDTPNEERALSMNSIVVCPWLSATPENECDATCSTCKTRKLDLALAPFRLIGIVNRIELRDTLEIAPNGEGRLVFGLTQGPADDPASRPLAMTVIFEYFLPETMSAKQWAEAWHHLGQLPDGEPFLAGLEDVTNRFVKRGSRPGAINGSALAQVRTNESTLNWIWQLREFGLGEDGLLALRPTWNTPAEQLNGTDSLREFIVANDARIREKKHVLPVSMRAGSADARRYSWSVSGVDPTTMRRFAEETCNGCHSSTTNAGAPIDSAFHLSPFRTGRSKVSLFMHNPEHETDELSLRATHLRRALCGH